MAKYVAKDGTVQEKNAGIFGFINTTFWGVIQFFVYFVQTLVSPQAADNIINAGRPSDNRGDSSGGGEAAPPCGGCCGG
ncbi:1402_t:CDS:2 [Ambispora leptoticha]|uniref:1402_t:CDS:1 n=1 Tax=Ambispora leptoticha TaxID=144679 RepID=A0A9N8W8A0_9GLOM|nr:1402_t:CDS:2 [Ambispora leptoticha]